MERSRSSVGTLVIGTITLGILGLLALAIVNFASTLPELSPHALERHKTQAEIAYEYVTSLPNADHCKWSCNDGRDRYVCGMDDGNWAVVVVEGAELITSFITNQEYAKGIINTPGCNNPWHYSHP